MTYAVILVIMVVISTWIIVKLILFLEGKSKQFEIEKEASTTNDVLLYTELEPKPQEADYEGNLKQYDLHNLTGLDEGKLKLANSIDNPTESNKLIFLEFIRPLPEPVISSENAIDIVKKVNIGKIISSLQNKTHCPFPVDKIDKQIEKVEFINNTISSALEDKSLEEKISQLNEEEREMLQQIINKFKEK